MNLKEQKNIITDLIEIWTELRNASNDPDERNKYRKLIQDLIKKLKLING